MTGTDFDDYDALNVLAFFVKNNNMDFFSYLINHPDPNNMSNADINGEKGISGISAKQNLASEPSLLMYASYIQQTVSDLVQSFKFQPSTITRSITHYFVMRMNPTVPFRDQLFYQMNPCESLSPFVFTAHTLSENNGVISQNPAYVRVFNTQEMGSWQGGLGLNEAKEPFVYPGRGTKTKKNGKLYQDVQRYYPSHLFSPDLACENAFVGRVSFAPDTALSDPNGAGLRDWMTFRVIRFAMFKNPMAAMKVGFNVTMNYQLDDKWTQGWRSAGSYSDIFDSDMRLSSSKGVDALAAKTYVAAQAGVTSANLNLPMVNPEPLIPEKEYLTEDPDDRIIMQTVLVLKVRVLYDTVYIKVTVYCIHVSLIRSNFWFFDL